MKLLTNTLLLLLLCNELYAQTQHLFTLAELEQLATCSDHPCFRKAVEAKDYEFSKTDKSTTGGVVLTTHTYYVLSTGQQPYRPEHLVTYVEHGISGRSVHFLTKSQSFPAQLDADIEQQGYVLTGQADPTQDRTYNRGEDGLIWTLDRNKPGFSASKGVPTYTVSLFSRPKPASRPVKPVAMQPTSDELPHLGGDWDAKYPPQNAADVFKAERQYAANYDRKHGKVGHTFSRAEKFRIQAKFTDQYRPLTQDRWSNSIAPPLQVMGFGAFADEYPRLYKQEALFETGGERVWMPIQEILISSLKKEAKAGQTVTLYAMLTSHHDFGGTLHLSFLVNEFAAPENNIPESTPPSPTLPPVRPTTTPTTPKPALISSGAEDFKTFIQRFSTDKAFQLSRVKFPFKREGYYNYEEKAEVKLAQRSQWRHVNYNEPSRISDGNEGVGNWTRANGENKDRNTESLGACGCQECACGYFMSHHFQRIAGKWFLIEETLVSQ